MQIELNGCTFTLLPERALYREDESILFIADIHLGKANHFRKSGIPFPAIAQANDFGNLKNLFLKTNPEKVYFLGDLFHSSFNRDWHLFAALIQQFSEIEFTLIKGNHDIIDKKLFAELHIRVEDECLQDNSFLYSHKPCVAKGKINIAGHIHPGILLSGIAKQTMKLPCFYLCNDILVLPAFGVLTGLCEMEKKKNAAIFVVLPNKIKRI